MLKNYIKLTNTFGVCSEVTNIRDEDIYVSNFLSALNCKLNFPLFSPIFHAF